MPDLDFVTLQSVDGQPTYLLVDAVVVIRPGSEEKTVSILLKSGQSITVKGNPLAVMRRIAGAAEKKGG
jgi:hypothetical protein